MYCSGVGSTEVLVREEYNSRADNPKDPLGTRGSKGAIGKVVNMITYRVVRKRITLIGKAQVHFFVKCHAAQGIQDGGDGRGRWYSEIRCLPPPLQNLAEGADDPRDIFLFSDLPSFIERRHHCWRDTLRKSSFEARG